MPAPRKILFREREGLVRRRNGTWDSYHDHDVFFDDRDLPAFSAGNRDACLDFIRRSAGPETTVIHQFQDVDLSRTRSWLNSSKETILNEDHLSGSREL
jgi:hypothetical protein